MPPTVSPSPSPAPAALTWQALGRVQPLWIQRGVSMPSQTLAADPALPQHLAYCVPGGVRRSLDGGVTWTLVPTMSAADALAGTPYALLTGGRGAVQCLEAALDPGDPHTLYAVFEGFQESAPPVYRLGFFSADDGQSWQLVPPPPGLDPSRFGGFQFAGPAVQALWIEMPGQPERGPFFIVTQTLDGGRSWALAHLACPPRGPCVRWGPAPNSFGGMGAPRPQWIVLSLDNGANWTTPATPPLPSAVSPVVVDIRSPGPHDLVALSPTTVALIAGGEGDPLHLSMDGGRSWRAVALPPRPGPRGGAPPWPALQMLPDGSLLTYTEDGPSWLLLEPGARAWCPAAASAPPTYPLAVQAAGTRLWWLLGGEGPNATPRLGSAPLTDLQCR